jgi:starch synthase
MSEIKVLFATSEITPLIKTGGLADVSGALPAALRAINVDVRVLVPGYPDVMAQLGPNEVVATFRDMPGFPPSRLIFSIMKSGVPLLVLDCPSLYQRDGGPYSDLGGHDWRDNALRFGLLSKIAAVLASFESPLAWRPDLLHGNDWQTGLAGVYLSVAPGAVPNIITIHNLAFQGNFRPNKVQLLHLPPASFDVNGIELYGNMSFLKAGLYYAHHITTVSPNYAQEACCMCAATILPAFSMALIPSSGTPKPTNICPAILAAPA